jgi:hypothetical protein
MEFELEFAAPVPEAGPAGRSVTPRLVPYPDSEVFFVANGGGRVFALRGVYYCYFEENWFEAWSLRGPWRFLEMKSVPRELFCVRGRPTPSAPEAVVARTEGGPALVRK